MIKGAIFDVDGTLLDSMHIWDTIGEDYLRSLGYEPKENLNEKFKRLSLHQAAEYYRSEYGVALSVQEICDEVNRWIDRFYREEVQLKPGVESFLQRLSERGVKLCIATATDEHLVRAALDRCGVLGFFSGIYTCTGVGSGKDEPYIYRSALEHLGTPRGETIVFEDALYALKTAKADGFVAAAVYDGHEREQQELQALADYYLPDYMNCEQFWKHALA